MTLSSALTVAFAVENAAPADVRSWVAVELAEFLTSGRRGFIVSTEPLSRTVESVELARQVREVIVTELRRQYMLPADKALGRAFAAGNSFVLDRTREAGLGSSGVDRIGATAVVFDGHIATIAHTPPGQLILIEDGLVYSVPPLESWLPHYADENADSPIPEPLGFATRVAPVVAQTDLRAGDTIIISSVACGQAFAEEMAQADVSSSSLAFLHGRDPDKILDVFRDLITDYEIDQAAVTVMGFAPLPDGLQVRTIGDVGRRARDTWRKATSGVSQVLPSRTASRSGNGQVGPEAVSAVAEISDADAPEISDDIATPRPARRTVLRSKSIHLAERLVERRQTTWEPPTEVRQFGVPGAHGVKAFRGSYTEMGQESWRNHLPRLPIRQSWVLVILCILLVAAIAGGAVARERWFVPEGDYRDDLAVVDRSILEARGLTDETEIDSAYLNAQRELEIARAAGAPADDIAQRQQAITEGRDEIHDVIRMDDVTRVGGLPSDLQSGTTRVVRTPGGLFFVSGSLYLLQPDAKQIENVLQSGTEIVPGVKVGNLYGIAYDSTGLYVTDGSYVYAYSAELEWRAVKLGEINNQGPWPAGPIGTFDSNLYILEADYRQIYQFDTDPDSGDTATANDWVVTSSRLNLDQAVDIAIDGSIYVLLDDGEVVKFFRGNIDSENPPKQSDYLKLTKDESVKSMVSGPATGYFYVAVTDGTEGRVVAFNPETGEAYQLELPAGFSTQGVDVKRPFEDLQAISVDEDSGTLYLINGDAIWSARFQLPVGASTGTPAATPDVPLP